jgi:hypothetical protein
MSGIVQIALAITTVALVATIVVNGKSSAQIITATTGGFANSLSAAQKG